MNVGEKEERVESKKAQLFNLIENKKDLHLIFRKLYNIHKSYKSQKNEIDQFTQLLKMKEAAEKHLSNKYSTIFDDDWMEENLPNDKRYSRLEYCGEAYVNQRKDTEKCCVFWSNEIDDKKLPKLKYINERIGSESVPDNKLHIAKGRLVLVLFFFVINKFFSCRIHSRMSLCWRLR